MQERLEDLSIGKILKDIDVKDYTTFKVSCKVSYLVIPDSIESLVRLLKFLRTEKIRYKVIGKGSNLVFVKDTFDGVLIRLDAFSNLEMKENKIIVGAGVSLIECALKLSNLGFTGLEFATGIPGTIGGAVVQNAGAYGSDMSHVVESIKILTPNYEIETWEREKINFYYRGSFLREHPEYICLAATFVLEKGEVEEILETIKERRKKRVDSQPLTYPSAGSVFRNPEGNAVGHIIEKLGFKGKRIGGAEVSQKHANFIINTGNATGKDILNLVTEIKEKVKKEYNIDLICEQEFVE